MSEKKSLEIRVSVDVGYRRHSVAIGLPDGQVLEEFEITRRPEGFREFFSRIEKHQKAQGCGVLTWEGLVSDLPKSINFDSAGSWRDIPESMPRECSTM